MEAQFVRKQCRRNILNCCEYKTIFKRLFLVFGRKKSVHSMPPTAAPHAIVISSGTKLMTVPNATNIGTAQSLDTLPKYAIGLFDSNKTGPRKRKRLTHLTPEEKIMRR